MNDTKKMRQELENKSIDELIEIILSKESEISDLKYEIERLNTRIRNIYEI